jgi:putative membrane protein
MDERGLRAAIPVLAVGKQLAELLVAVAAYCVFVRFMIDRYELTAFDPGNSATLVNGVILGLLYGFRNRTAYDRWWEARRLWGQLVNDSRNLVCKLAAFVPAVELARTSAAALVTGFADALKRRLRDDIYQLSDLPGLESEAARPPHIPTYIAARLFEHIAEWKRAHILDDGALLALDVNLRGLLDVCGGCERIHNTPISLAYKSMLRCGLALNVLFAPWFVMPNLGWMGLPVLLITCLFVLGVELIDTRIEQPFGRDPEDLDLDRYCQTIAESVTMVLPATKSPSA